MKRIFSLFDENITILKKWENKENEKIIKELSSIKEDFKKPLNNETGDSLKIIENYFKNNNDEELKDKLLDKLIEIKVKYQAILEQESWFIEIDKIIKLENQIFNLWERINELAKIIKTTNEDKEQYIKLLKAKKDLLSKVQKQLEQNKNSQENQRTSNRYFKYTQELAIKVVRIIDKEQKLKVKINNLIKNKISIEQKELQLGHSNDSIIKLLEQIKKQINVTIQNNENLELFFIREKIKLLQKKDTIANEKIKELNNLIKNKEAEQKITTQEYEKKSSEKKELKNLLDKTNVKVSQLAKKIRQETIKTTKLTTKKGFFRRFIDKCAKIFRPKTWLKKQEKMKLRQQEYQDNIKQFERELKELTEWQLQNNLKCQELRKEINNLSNKMEIEPQQLAKLKKDQTQQLQQKNDLKLQLTFFKKQEANINANIKRKNELQEEWKKATNQLQEKEKNKRQIESTINKYQAILALNLKLNSQDKTKNQSEISELESELTVLKYEILLNQINVKKIENQFHKFSFEFLSFDFKNEYQEIDEEYSSLIKQKIKMAASTSTENLEANQTFEALLFDIMINEKIEQNNLVTNFHGIEDKREANNNLFQQT